MAHEIGHNLGMDHDFSGSPGTPRFDSKGATCTKIQGVMDYYQVNILWIDKESILLKILWTIFERIVTLANKHNETIIFQTAYTRWSTCSVEDFAAYYNR
jgi:hypothetical protein